MQWIKVAILRRSKVIKDKLKQVTFVVEGSHVTQQFHVSYCQRICFKTYFTRGLLAQRLIPGRCDTQLIGKTGNNTKT